MTHRRVRAGCPDERARRGTGDVRRAVGKAVLFLTAALTLLGLALAADITITGTWSWTIGPGDLQGGPGSNLNTTYTSAPNQVTMRITGTGGGGWRVDVLRIDSNWHTDFVLDIRRTGNGQGPGTISGGTTYLTITTTSQTFVTGTRNRRGIPLQERLRGVSVAIPAAVYTTTIQYTVVDQ
jgi:hypothetical protein